MIKFGLISKLDSEILMRTIDLICDEFNDIIIYVTEIGIYSGETGSGIFKYLWDIKDRNVEICGIDNFKDGEEFKFFGDYENIITGNSNEVYNQLQDNSQHLIFQDACHCFSCVISSFYCYADKVKVGGYMAFHDTGKHIQMFKDFQHGDKDNPDAYISARKALNKIGLLIDTENFHLKVLNKYKMQQWELIFDEADETDLAGGITIFKKLY